MPGGKVGAMQADCFSDSINSFLRGAVLSNVPLLDSTGRRCH